MVDEIVKLEKTSYYGVDQSQRSLFMDLHLRGKRALVTGSSSGIGAEIARMLASEGVKVVVHGRDKTRAKTVAQRIESAGGQAVVALGDLNSEAGAASVVETAQQAFDGAISW
jgi:3-oxoacyl-[acyl-carrier protein] reductase